MAVPQIAVFTKFYSDRGLYLRELKGRQFIEQYWQNVPKLLSSSECEGTFSLVYADVRFNDPKPTLVTELLGNNLVVQNWSEILNLYLYVTKNFIQHHKAGGGTQLFYIDRIGNLDKILRNDYKDVRSYDESYIVNGKTISLSEDLIGSVLKAIGGMRVGLCIPSQGDFHERNIYSDGTVVDFEGAGWNLLATDVATFLWHSFFVGNHFGPLYAIWSTNQDKHKLSIYRQQIRITDLNVSIELNSARHKFICNYVDNYLFKLNFNVKEAEAVSSAIAFRLLSMFNVPTIELPDRKLVYILANYFLQYPLLDAINNLLN